MIWLDFWRCFNVNLRFCTKYQQFLSKGNWAGYTTTWKYKDLLQRVTAVTNTPLLPRSCSWQITASLFSLMRELLIKFGFIGQSINREHGNPPRSTIQITLGIEVKKKHLETALIRGQHAAVVSSVVAEKTVTMLKCNLKTMRCLDMVSVSMLEVHAEAFWKLGVWMGVTFEVGPRVTHKCLLSVVFLGCAY